MPLKDHESKRFLVDRKFICAQNLLSFGILEKLEENGKEMCEKSKKKIRQKKNCRSAHTYTFVKALIPKENPLIYTLSHC